MKMKENRVSLQAFKQYISSLAQFGGSELSSCQPLEIIPNLYLGDIYTAANAHSIRKKGITHILNCSNLKEDAEFFKNEWPEWSLTDSADWSDCEDEDLDSSTPPTITVTTEYGETIFSEVSTVVVKRSRSGSGKRSRSSSRTYGNPQPPIYFTLPLSNSSTFKVSPYFAQSNQFIHSAIATGGSVLVHSQSANSRSVALILAYLVSVKSMLLDDAFHLCSNVKKITKIHCGFASELVSLHDEIHLKGRSLRIVNVRGCEEFEGSFVKKESSLDKRYPAQCIEVGISRRPIFVVKKLSIDCPVAKQIRERRELARALKSKGII